MTAAKRHKTLHKRNYSNIEDTRANLCLKGAGRGGVLKLSVHYY